jgi:glycosyltransferase involved in cell wall biosynthesis
MKICHIGTLPLEQMGTITRTVFAKTVGEHVYARLGEEIPDADVYVLECFKNRWQEFYNFAPRNPQSKVVSLVHSSLPCRPSLYSDRIVCLTQYSAWTVRKEFSRAKVDVIPGGIDLSPFTPDYASRRFGRISRNAPGKFHPEWNAMAKRILDSDPGTELKIATDHSDRLLRHERAVYVCGIRIDCDEEKYRFLSELSVAVFAHGNFEEVFPMAVLEAMAARLPVLYLYQPSIREMVGEGQFCAHTMDKLEELIRLFLEDEALRIEWGERASRRAGEFYVKRMVYSWNALFEELAS